MTIILSALGALSIIAGLLMASLERPELKKFIVPAFIIGGVFFIAAIALPKNTPGITRDPTCADRKLEYCVD